VGSPYFNGETAGLRLARNRRVNRNLRERRGEVAGVTLGLEEEGKLFGDVEKALGGKNRGKGPWLRPSSKPRGDPFASRASKEGVS